jgi:hypothetical protein
MKKKADRGISEMFGKRTIVVLAIIVGLSLSGVSVYMMHSKSSPERILVEGKPVYFGSVSLHPENSKVEATAFWGHNLYPREGSSETEWQIHVFVKLVELDVNRTYRFQNAWFYGEDLNKEPVIGDSSTFYAGISYSEGDVIQILFGSLTHAAFGNGTIYYTWKLKTGNTIDVVLPFYVIKETVVEGQSFWAETMPVGELKFSVKVDGEPSSECKS